MVSLYSHLSFLAALSLIISSATSFPKELLSSAWQQFPH